RPSLHGRPPSFPGPDGRRGHGSSVFRRRVTGLLAPKDRGRELPAYVRRVKFREAGPAPKGTRRRAPRAMTDSDGITRAASALVPGDPGFQGRGSRRLLHVRGRPRVAALWPWPAAAAPDRHGAPPDRPPGRGGLHLVDLCPTEAGDRRRGDAP